MYVFINDIYRTLIMSLHQSAQVLLLGFKLFIINDGFTVQNLTKSISKGPLDHPQHLHRHVGFKLYNLKTRGLCQL